MKASLAVFFWFSAACVAAGSAEAEGALSRTRPPPTPHGDGPERLVERGRQHFFQDQPLHALLFLQEAYRNGRSDDELRLLLSASVQAVDPLQLALQAPCPVPLAVAVNDERLLGVCRDGRAFALGRDGRPLGTSQLPGAPLLAARIDEAGQAVQAVGQAGDLFTWDLSASRKLSLIKLPAKPLRCAALSPEGRRLFLSRSDQKQLLDITPGQPVKPLKTWPPETQRAPRQAFFSTDGDSVIAIDDRGALSVWDTYDTFGYPYVLRKYGKPPFYYTAALLGEQAKDQEILHERDRVVRAWNTYSLHPAVRFLARPFLVRRAARSPDGTLIAAAAPDGTIQVFLADSGARVALLAGQRGEIAALAFDARGTSLLSAGQDGSLRLWSLSGGTRGLVLREHAGPVRGAAFHPDGKRLLTTSEDGVLRIFDAARGQLLGSHESVSDAYFQAMWTPDGRDLLRLAGGRKVADLLHPEPDTNRLMGDTSAWRWTLSRLAPQGGSVSSLVQAKGPPRLSFTMSADGQRLVVLARGVDRSWTATWLHGSIGLGPKNSRYLLTAPHEQAAELWDLDAGRKLALLREGRKSILSAAMSGDGQRLATADSDGCVQVWDLPGGRLRQWLQLDDEEIFEVALSADGRRLAAAGAKRDMPHLGQVHVWNADSGVPLASWEGEGAALSVVFDASGTRLLTAQEGGTAQIFNLAGETRTPAELDALLRCRVPLRLVNESAAPAPAALNGCIQTTAPPKAPPALDGQRTLRLAEALATRYLREASLFGVGAIGASGRPVEAWYGLETLLHRPHRAALLLRMLFAHPATTHAGRLYALCGLRALGEPELGRHLAVLRPIAERITVAPGGCRVADHLTVGQVAELLAEPEAHPDRLSYPDPDFWRHLCSLPAPLTP